MYGILLKYPHNHPVFSHALLSTCLSLYMIGDGLFIYPSPIEEVNAIKIISNTDFLAK